MEVGPHAALKTPKGAVAKRPYHRRTDTGPSIDRLHQRVRELAKQENISINQFVSTALAEKISALLTQEYLEERASRGSRREFDCVLAKVRDVEPDEQDRL